MFLIGKSLAHDLSGGELILLYGGLGAGKTLMTKGILDGLGFDVDEVTSPSFTLVNLYKTESLDVFHIDLWRLEGAADPAEAVGLGEILEDVRAVAIVEWAERLEPLSFSNKVIAVSIEGDGEDPRIINIKKAGFNRMLTTN